jgi:hypothetical protein
MEWEDEETWLRRRLIRLRTIWRFAKDPRIEAGLREFIAEAEDRLELLESGTNKNCLNQNEAAQRGLRKSLSLSSRIGKGSVFYLRCAYRSDRTCTDQSYNQFAAHRRVNAAAPRISESS